MSWCILKWFYILIFILIEEFNTNFLSFFFPSTGLPFFFFQLIEQVGLSRHSLQQQDDHATMVKGKDSSSNSSKANQQKKKQPRK